MADDKLLDIEIITPQGLVYSGKGVSISLPGSLSPFQVLYNHAPIVTSLDLGTIKIIDNSQVKYLFASDPGFAEIHNNKVSVLVESAINAKDVNLAFENDALKVAQDKLKDTKVSEEILSLTNSIKQIQNKIKVTENITE